MGTAVGVPLGLGAAIGVDIQKALGPGVEVVRYPDAPLGMECIRSGVTALIPGSHSVGERVFEQLPLLRLVSVPGTGVWDSVDIAAASRHGVAVCNVRDYGTDAVAEFALGLILALVRHIPRASDAVRGGRWNSLDFVGTELRDRTLGIVGYGVIGTRVAELAAAVGMRVVCATRRAKPEGLPERGVTVVDLDTLLSDSDIVSLHARLTRQTRGLIGRHQFGLMRRGSLFVNTARGGLVDQQALVDVLVSGHLGGAALDVTDPEPLPEGHELTRLDNVIITPHMGAATHDALRRSLFYCLDNIRHFFEGRPTSVVNPDALK